MKRKFTGSSDPKGPDTGWDEDLIPRCHRTAALDAALANETLCIHRPALSFIAGDAYDEAIALAAALKSNTTSQEKKIAWINNHRPVIVRAAHSCRIGHGNELANAIATVFLVNTQKGNEEWINADPTVIIFAAEAAAKGYGSELARAIAQVLENEETPPEKKKEWLLVEPEVLGFAAEAAAKGLGSELARAIATVLTDGSITLAEMSELIDADCLVILRAAQAAANGHGSELARAIAPVLANKEVQQRKNWIRVNYPVIKCAAMAAAEDYGSELAQAIATLLADKSTILTPEVKKEWINAEPNAFLWVAVAAAKGHPQLFNEMFAHVNNTEKVFIKTLYIISIFAALNGNGEIIVKLSKNGTFQNLRLGDINLQDFKDVEGVFNIQHMLLASAVATVWTLEGGPAPQDNEGRVPAFRNLCKICSVEKNADFLNILLANLPEGEEELRAWCELLFVARSGRGLKGEVSSLVKLALATQLEHMRGQGARNRQLVNEYLEDECAMPAAIVSAYQNDRSP